MSSHKNDEDDKLRYNSTQLPYVLKVVCDERHLGMRQELAQYRKRSEEDILDVKKKQDEINSKMTGILISLLLVFVTIAAEVIMRLAGV